MFTKSTRGVLYLFFQLSVRRILIIHFIKQLHVATWLH